MNIDPTEIRFMVRMATQRTGAPLHDEDLEQDAMLKVVEAFTKRREIRHPRAFLMKVVLDAVRDHWRRRRPLEHLSVLDELRCVELPRFEDDLDRRRQRETLRQALLSLEEDKRIILELFYAEDCSIAEIARRQKKTLSAVKMQLARSRRLLAGIVVALSNKKSRS